MNYNQIIMEESSILLTLTQVTVAFVGFAAIVATFQFKNGFTIKRGDTIGLELIINTGLVGSFFSVFPLILSSFGLDDSSVWTWSSGIMCVNYLGFIYYLYANIKISNYRRKKSKIILYIYFIIGFLVIILNLLNVFNVVFNKEFAPFFISLIYPLCLVGFMFSRLIFLPIWRTLKNQELKNS